MVRLIADDLASLRTAASPVFSKANFRDVRWAGVFGSFALGTQDDSSIVEVIVIETSHSEKIDIPPLHLKRELFKVWGRKVDITYIKEGKFVGYTSVEALLRSHTLTGSDQDDEVVRLRDEAWCILVSGLDKFTAILGMIRETQSLVEGITIEACNYSAAFLSCVCPSNHANNHQPGISNIAKAPAFRSIYSLF
jgi:predicted nucleotidyltransferase